jgi:cobalt-zinc-cadmium efflux system protein
MTLHQHPHPHSHNENVSRKLLIATIATMVFVFAELAAGIYSNSLSLIGDSFHNFTDSLALLLALAAVRIEKRPPTSSKSYGYQRAGVLAAFINAGTLVALTIYLFVEAIQRLRLPKPVDTRAMLITAAFGVLLNAAITLSLRREGKHDLNVRSAVLHMLGDAIASAGIIVAAILIRVTGAAWWDAAMTIAIAVLILASSWSVLREAVNLLLEGTPSGIDPEAVTRAIAAIDGVFGVHHLHIWALAPSRPALSCHLMVGDVPVRMTGNLLAQVNELLEREYGIAHTTIQFEFASCDVADPFCVPYSASAE